jgi:putative ABC transport system permease protein
MGTARLALRNLSRNRRRTLLTGIVIVAGVAFSIAGNGFQAGMDESIILAATDGTVGHVMARPRDYPTQGQQRPVDALLQLGPQTRTLLDAEAVAWTTRTWFAPTAAHGRDSLRVSAIGFDPVRDEQVFPRTHWKVEGSLPGTARPEVGVSPRVARLIGVGPGDTLVLQVRTHRGAINALEVTVSGIVSTGIPAQDMLGMWVPAPLAEALIAAEAPTHLSVKLDRRDTSEAFAARLQTSLGEGAEVVTWQDETAELLQMEQVKRNSLNLVVFVLLGLAAFGIANTILMAAHERVREIGTLRSLGMTEGGVVKLFLLEGSLTGLLGGVVGALLGGGLMAHWARHPFDFSQTYEQQQAALAVSALVYTRFELAHTLAAVAMGTIVAVIASLYPARVASRMSPAEAVRAS